MAQEPVPPLPQRAIGKGRMEARILDGCHETERDPRSTVDEMDSRIRQTTRSHDVLGKEMMA